MTSRRVRAAETACDVEWSASRGYGGRGSFGAADYRYVARHGRLYVVERADAHEDERDRQQHGKQYARRSTASICGECEGGK